jgi:hypothetical protein
MEAGDFSDTLITSYHTTRNHNPDDGKLYGFLVIKR